MRCIVTKSTQIDRKLTRRLFPDVGAISSTLILVFAVLAPPVSGLKLEQWNSMLLWSLVSGNFAGRFRT